jgi:hypothetical protein
MYFCMDDMRAIRSLIDTLRIPSLEPRVNHCLLACGLDTNFFLGSRFRHVFRTSEHQDASLVQGFHQRQAPDWYAMITQQNQKNILIDVINSLSEVSASFTTKWQRHSSSTTTA